MCTPHKWVQSLLIGRHEKPYGFIETHSQSRELVGRANKGLSFICGRLIVEPCPVHITAHVISCFSIIYINGTKLSLSRLRFHLRPTRQYGKCLLRLQPRHDFCELFACFSVLKLLRTILNYLILCQGLGLRFWVM